MLPGLIQGAKKMQAINERTLDLYIPIYMCVKMCLLYERLPIFFNVSKSLATKIAIYETIVHTLIMRCS